MPRDRYGRELADSVQWAQVRTLTDAGHVTARWLEGTMQYHPINLAPGPDEETSTLIKALAAMNRRGFVTDWSQPAVRPRDGSAQRAVVAGYCDQTVGRRLVDRLAPTELLVLAAGPEDDVPGLAAVPVTIDDGGVLTGAGCFSSGDDIRQYFSDFPTVAELLVGAWEVHVIDPRWGRNDYLWPLVLGVLGSG